MIILNFCLEIVWLIYIYILYKLLSQRVLRDTSVKKNSKWIIESCEKHRSAFINFLHSFWYRLPHLPPTCLESMAICKGNSRLCKFILIFRSDPLSHFSQLSSLLQPNLSVYSQLRETAYWTKFVHLWRGPPPKMFSWPKNVLVTVVYIVQKKNFKMYGSNHHIVEYILWEFYKF